MTSKQLKIDFYEDGISEMQFNCRDIPIAAACGKYNRENYFYYLLQMCFRTNWLGKDGKRMEYSECLKKIGLKLEALTVNDAEALIPTIINQIEQDYPVLLPVSYFEMFFCASYKRKIESHYLLVDGYVEENKIITLREELNIISASKLEEINGLYPLRLKYDMVREMWSQSKEVIEPRWRDKIFVIKPIEGNLIHSERELMQDFLNQYSKHNLFEESMLAARAVTKDQLDQEIREIRYNHLKLIYAMFYLLEKLCKNKVRAETIKSLTLLKEAYLKSRETVVSELHISCLKNRSMAVETIFEEIKEYDTKLFDIVEIISEELAVLGSDAQKKERSLIKECVITADSCEHEVIKSPYNVAKDDDSIWKSEKKAEPHWLCFELPDDIPVHELIITHHEESHKLTKDFCIQISDDNRTWKTVETVENNYCTVTRHLMGKVKTKYIRIYITLAALKKPVAIIRNVTIL